MKLLKRIWEWYKDAVITAQTEEEKADYQTFSM